MSYNLYNQRKFLGLNWGIKVFYARLTSATYTFADKSTDIRSKQHLYGGGVNTRLFLTDNWALITEFGYLWWKSDSAKIGTTAPTNDSTNKGLPYIMGGMELDLINLGTARLGLNAKYQWSTDIGSIMAGLNLNF